MGYRLFKNLFNFAPPPPSSDISNFYTTRSLPSLLIPLSHTLNPTHLRMVKSSILKMALKPKCHVTTSLPYWLVMTNSGLKKSGASAKPDEVVEVVGSSTCFEKFARVCNSIARCTAKAGFVRLSKCKNIVHA